jgi:hypothetical protein
MNELMNTQHLQRIDKDHRERRCVLLRALRVAFRNDVLTLTQFHLLKTRHMPCTE